MKTEIPITEVMKIDWKKMMAVIIGVVIGLSIIVFIYLKFFRYR